MVSNTLIEVISLVTQVRDYMANHEILKDVNYAFGGSFSFILNGMIPERYCNKEASLNDIDLIILDERSFKIINMYNKRYTDDEERVGDVS